MARVSHDAESKTKAVEEVRRAVAVYQGQATLGKIINVVIHEGRRPLNYFRNQIPNLKYWDLKALKDRDLSTIEKILPLVEGIGENADIFSELFGKLDPLATARRTKPSSLYVKKIIQKTIAVFKEEIKVQEVSIEITGPDDFCYIAWSQDIYAIFTNLIDNSLYWMKEGRVATREIAIQLMADGDSLLQIDFRDTGPGIEPYLIESEVIFEPHFSTKPNGVGLGLAISGEAARRNGLDLIVIESDLGAWFRLQPKEED